MHGGCTGCERGVLGGSGEGGGAHSGGGLGGDGESGGADGGAGGGGG